MFRRSWMIVLGLLALAVGCRRTSTPVSLSTSPLEESLEEFTAAYEPIRKKEQAELERTINQLRAKVKTGRADAATYAQLARGLLAPETLEEAFSWAQEAVLRDEQSDAAHLVLGDCLLQRGEWSAAFAEFEQATRCNPENVWGWRALAVMYRQRENHEAARQSYQTALAHATAQDEPWLWSRPGLYWGL